MTCQQVQKDLSLYLYGELDFAREEELETHLSECAFCQRALAREKEWHTAANAERMDVPFDLLSQCRRDLRSVISTEKAQEKSAGRKFHWPISFDFGISNWSFRLATASFLIFIGFGAGRLLDQKGFRFASNGPNEMGLFDPATTRIRDIRSGGDNQVHIIVDQMQERQITGRVEDEAIRRILLAAMQDQTDPGIQVDSLEMLKGHTGEDVRDTLIRTLKTDANAGVRLKALESLRSVADDGQVRETLKYVLQHDQDPGVRSEAIDVLAPAGEKLQFSPDLIDTLQAIAQTQQDEYVRLRCLQALHQVHAAAGVY